MKHNIDDVEDMIELGRRLGAREIAFRKIKLLGRALKLKDEVYPTPEDMAGVYARLYRYAYGGDKGLRINAKYNDSILQGRGELFNRLPCGAGRNIVHITYNGDIVPCSLFTEPKFVVGNVRKDSIRQVWESSELLSFFREITVDEIPKCKGCEFKYVCGGGCRAEAYFLKGDLLDECCDCEDLLLYYHHFFMTTGKNDERVTI